MYSIPDCPWALQVSDWNHKIQLACSREISAIMNIKTALVYRAGRQDIKASLLMMNIKERSVFRDGRNYVYWRLKTNFFNVCNSWNDPATVLKKELWKISTGDSSVKVWFKAHCSQQAALQARLAPRTSAPSTSLCFLQCLRKLMNGGKHYQDAPKHTLV